MADNLFPEAVVTPSGSKLCFAETTFGGDTVFVGASFLGIITGAEGSRTFTPIVAGAGVVDGGTQRMTLASDDPAVAKLGLIDGKTPALGQALAAASVPVVLTAAQITTLTPPAAIAGFATSAKQDTIIASLSSIDGHVDGVEGSLTSIDAKITAVNTGAVVIASSALPTGAATAARQDTGNTSLGSIDAKLPALGQALAAASVPIVLTAAQLATLTPLTTVAVTNVGTFAVQADTELPAAAALADGAANPTTPSVGSCLLIWNGATWDRLKGSSSNGVFTQGAIAHDAIDTGNPVKLGAKATASVLGETPVTAGDRTNLFSGTDGVPIDRPHTSLEDIISDVKTNTDGASTAMTGAFAATASQRIYLTTLIIANSSASNITVDIRDGAAGSVLITVPVPANGGVVINLPVPLRFSANTAAAFDPSAAASTVSTSMIGFKSKC